MTKSNGTTMNRPTTIYYIDRKDSDPQRYSSNRPIVYEFGHAMGLGHSDHPVMLHIKGQLVLISLACIQSSFTKTKHIPRGFCRVDFNQL